MSNENLIDNYISNSIQNNNYSGFYDNPAEILDIHNNQETTVTNGSKTGSELNNNIIPRKNFIKKPIIEKSVYIPSRENSVKKAKRESKKLARLYNNYYSDTLKDLYSNNKKSNCFTQKSRNFVEKKKLIESKDIGNYLFLELKSEMKFGDKIFSVYHDQFERQYNYLFCLPSILKDVSNNSNKKIRNNSLYG